LSFKRFAFVIIGVGLVFYLFSNLSSLNTKVKIISGLIGVLLILFLTTDFISITQTRYLERGGEHFLSTEAFLRDVRMHEVSYVYHEISDNTRNLLLGSQGHGRISIYSDRHQIEDWPVHNQYAQYLLMMGTTGLLIYFFIFILLYKKVKADYLRVRKNSKPTSFAIQKQLWLFFNALFFIFLLAGIIGGLDKITIRGLVFVFLGAIGGHFHKLATNLEKTKQGFLKAP
jgi:hypothetical protein